MHRGTVVIVAAAAIATATYGIRAFEPDDPARRIQRLDPPVVLGPGSDAGGFGAPSGRSREQEVDRLIAFYEEQARRQPSTLDLTFLGQLYLQRGRLTGDVATYGQAQEALELALEISPHDSEALALLAQTRFTSHDFTGALRLAEDRLASDKGDLSALAVAGDARLELGNLEGASDAYAEIARRVPDAAPVLVRLARVAWLRGDAPGATSLAAAADSAASAAGLGGVDLAWYRSYRGQLEIESGRYRVAIELYRSAVRMAPRYHLPRAGLGRALAAIGRTGGAIRHYRLAVDLLPDPTYIAALGDLYELAGRFANAREQFATVEAIASLSRVNEQIYNRPLVVFLADHGLKPERAVELAADELRVRKDLYGWDAYAWALHGAGRYTEARTAADEALELGTPDARLLYHSGMIAAALGDMDRARSDLGAALEMSPAFDPVHAPIARRMLEGLEEA